MKRSLGLRNSARTWALAACAASTLGMTGCQVDVGGQTLPSPYYLKDDVQYFAPGPEFKLQREATAIKAAKAARQAQQLEAPNR
ncbi:MAG: hypothetical protein K1X74_21480 [Pirellulales bacterium]|nr:hypothetical protein [Pirellulales bacterium]